MSKSDGEMDDDKKLPGDSGKNVQGPEKGGENVPPKVSGAGNAIVSENWGEDVNKSIDEDADISTAKNEETDQAILKAETNEEMDASISEHCNPKSETVEPTSTKTDDQASPRMVEEKQMDAKNEAVVQNGINDEVEGKRSSDNGMDGNDNMKTANENVEDQNPEENADSSAGEDKIMNHLDAEKNSKETEQLPSDKASENINAENDSFVDQKIPIALSDNEAPQNTESDPKENSQLTTDLSTDEAPQNMNTKNDSIEDRQLSTELSANEAPQNMNANINVVPHDEEMEDATDLNKEKTGKHDLKERVGETVVYRCGPDGTVIPAGTVGKHVREVPPPANRHGVATPLSLARASPAKSENHSGETVKASFTPAALPPVGESDDGTPEEQAAFMKDLENFHKEKQLDFKPPKFYGKPLNCLKLWRAVIRLGGYDRVSGCKLWRQVGESFHPPKTCTTVSWTFRIFYEKSLLEYERHKTQSGEVPLPAASFPEATSADVEGSVSGRTRRDSATRAMQGWHVQRLFSSGEVGEPVIKDKNPNNTPRREKNLKSIGSLKQKRPDEVEQQSNKAPRTEVSRQLDTQIVDVGAPADWVKINVMQNKDCYEIYALVPGLLREEVRVQTDPAGRVVITGQPEQVENPWGITPFRKVVSLPTRIDPIQTSAVFSLHGRLLIRVPFEQMSDA
ncbi:AT-rich interactive domain-containing protein 5-like isoform X2 [Andrographis paniculata]|uniref:AT-rich interactive domain-containing protein 5-like isoform X2 n=1 Tax=Andrographis paniculata TaxID=175694 RepID=UPI0021E8BF3B|nr:AT-rich interactive domain-containing protein 5-like isoform X2 [Andrographis paniculata]